MTFEKQLTITGVTTSSLCSFVFASKPFYTFYGIPNEGTTHPEHDVGEDVRAIWFDP